VTSADCLWRIVSDEKATVFGTSPAYLQLCESLDRVVADLDFTALRAILSTGSILYPRQQDWVQRDVKPLPVQSISGGTDIVGCFVLGNPNLPVYSTECQCRSLGLDVQALHANRSSQGSLVGELICANPFPSRPLGFLNDPDGTRFHAAYFSDNPGVWTHGDLIEFTPEGSALMHGRSDGVLNIRGIRVGPAEIYRILEDVPEISEAMAIEQYAGDALGNAVEAAFAFGLDLDFDDGFDEVGVDFVVVDDGLVAEDDLVVLVLLDAALDFVGGEVEHLGQISRRSQRVFFEEF